MADQTIICRCEDVTREDILAAINDGCRTLDEIKRITRAGMGPCQGRTCRNLIAQELARIYGISVEDVRRELAGRHVINKKVKQEKMASDKM